MTVNLRCNKCGKVTLMVSDPKEPCSTENCGSTNREIISGDRVIKDFEHGVTYNIDPRTGERAKKRR